MKTTATATDSTSQAFLTGTILFANLDYSALGEYAVKAIIGGAIWMIFKLAGDYLSARLPAKKGKANNDNKTSNNEPLTTEEENKQQKSN